MTISIAATKPSFVCPGDRNPGFVATTAAEAIATAWPALGCAPECAHEHVVVATDTAAGGAVAVLAADTGSTPYEDFVFLAAVAARPVARQRRLFRRMFGLLLLQIARTGGVPDAVAAEAGQEAACGLLADVAPRFAGATLFRGRDQHVLPLQTIALSRRIGGSMSGQQPWPRQRLAGEGAGPRFGGGPANAARRDFPAVLDLRSSPEEVLLDEARRLYRSR